MQPASSSANPQSPLKPKKPLKKKRKRVPAPEALQVVADEKDAEDRPAKRRLPETVLDPSVSLTGSHEKPVSANVGKTKLGTKKRKKQDRQDEELFKDSRGTVPSMFSAAYF